MDNKEQKFLKMQEENDKEAKRILLELEMTVKNFKENIEKVLDTKNRYCEGTISNNVMSYMVGIYEMLDMALTNVNMSHDDTVCGSMKCILCPYDNPNKNWAYGNSYVNCERLNRKEPI